MWSLSLRISAIIALPCETNFNKFCAQRLSSAIKTLIVSVYD